MKRLYTTSATAIGGRNGRAATAADTLRISFAAPVELGGEGRQGNNPEELFAAAYAACFLEALKLAASRSGTVLAPDANVTASVGVGENGPGSALALEVALSVDLPGLQDETTSRLMQGIAGQRQRSAWHRLGPDRRGWLHRRRQAGARATASSSGARRAVTSLFPAPMAEMRSAHAGIPEAP
jgi:osmotically inducible protein OsmC